MARRQRSFSPQAFTAAIVLSLSAVPAFAAHDDVRPDSQIEADWLAQARLRYQRPLDAAPGAITNVEDAAGGCDGIINGLWGFHTAQQLDPWWQVDLGEIRSLDHIDLYNRCDRLAERAANVCVLLSPDGVQFTQAYQHDGTVFLGFPDKRPLRVDMHQLEARFVRLQLRGHVYFHLDEVQVFATGSDQNVALNRPATQSSISEWSQRDAAARDGLDWSYILDATIRRGRQLAAILNTLGIETETSLRQLDAIEKQVSASVERANEGTWQSQYLAARRAIRQLALSNPLLDFQDLLFVKRAPSMFPHLSDQYYGWWSRPGGGIFILRDWKTPHPQLDCLTSDWPAGNFLRPDLSHDGERVLFAYSQYFTHVADLTNKREKGNLPESVFYHLHELDLTTGDHRALTRGKYDDFDGRYLPNGDIAFLSTRKGQFLQSIEQNTQQTIAADLPDSYVRCGGDDYRPVPVFTLHRMDGWGRRLRPISAFETFEYTPSVANDGRILYCRWDYIDRFNGHFFSLWSTNQDGTNSQLVYGNFTKRPQATMEPRSIPGSNKILFTAAAHHSITGGSLVLLDQTKGLEGELPLERLTPEVPFPETEENVGMYYANPWPLSEDFYLVSWSDQKLPPHRRVQEEVDNPSNAQGIYLADRFGNLELLYRDPQISSMTPLPILARPPPPEYSSQTANTSHASPGDEVEAVPSGSFAIQDIYQGMPDIVRGTVKRLRIIGAVPKVQPTMNQPSLGVSREETGKFILGTVPIEADGSAHFKIPAGIPVFFQALNEAGFAIQTMRSLTYVQAGQTLSCIGCHESRGLAPAGGISLAMRRRPSHIDPELSGTWPLRFDQLVQPLLDEHCVECHRAGAREPAAAAFDLTAANAWQTLIGYANDDLKNLVFERDTSVAGFSPARESQLMKLLQTDATHRHLKLTREDHQRLITWIDTYGQTQGAFSAEQESKLKEFRRRLNRVVKQ